MNPGYAARLAYRRRQLPTFLARLGSRPSTIPHPHTSPHIATPSTPELVHNAPLSWINNFIHE